MSFLRLSLCLLPTLSFLQASEQKRCEPELAKYDSEGLYQPFNDMVPYCTMGIRIDSNVSIVTTNAVLDSDVTKKILKKIYFVDLCNMRKCTKHLSAAITFYEEYSKHSMDLTLGYRLPFQDPYFKDAETQQYFEMLRKKKLTMNMVYFRNGNKEGLELFLDVWFAQKPPMVNFSGDCFEKEGSISVFAEKLSFNNHLRSVSIFVEKMSEADQKSVGVMLEKCPNLKNLEIKQYRYQTKGQLSDSAMKILAVPLSNHKNIESLSFYGNRITDEGAAILAQALAKNESLTDLSLFRNSVGDKGALLLEEVGKKHKKLKQIDIRENYHAQNPNVHASWHLFNFKKDL